jgi:nifR3 family TIM-barrel protein
MLQIGSIKLKNCLVMAPLAGITNLPFRVIVKNLGAGLVTTEMISAKGLTLGHQRTFKYLKSQPEEKPLSVQIFGPDADVMAAAAQIAIEKGASIIDINMGCPARKVVKTGSGSHLLRAPQRVREIVSAVRRVCSVPLTVKIRAGWSPNQPAALEIAKIIEDCGADAITIHPRYATQGFSGKADWSIIAETKAHLKIPVIGNGDVSSPSSAIEMKRQTGCDGVMIGRAAVGNPWIFKQTLEMIQGLEITSPGLTERRALIEEHFRLLTLDLGEPTASKVMRGLLLRYTKGLPNSSRFRGAFTRIRSLEESMSALDSYFTDLEKHFNSSEPQASLRGFLIERTA